MKEIDIAHALSSWLASSKCGRSSIERIIHRR
jgi:hypothetical protein